MKQKRQASRHYEPHTFQFILSKSASQPLHCTSLAPKNNIHTTLKRQKQLNCFDVLYINKLHRAFHNVLRHYKYLYQENQRTYLIGIFHSHSKTDFFLTTRDIRCVLCHPWCTHRTSLVVKNKNQFYCGCEKFQ